jgi:predicted metal-dependent hydrolase
VTTDATIMTVGPLKVTVVRKAIKNLHLGVYPPDGHIRLAAPVDTPESVLRAAVAKRLSWIKGQRARFAAQPREPEREFIDGETIWLFGRRYRLRVVDAARGHGVRVRGRILELRCGVNAGRTARKALIETWWRSELRAVAKPLMERWSDNLGVTPVDWRVRKMKTKWGSLSPRTGRLWLNTELARRPHRCIEYIVVHELAHLVERRHDPAFQGLMDRHLPDWRSRRTELGLLPLSHQDWD